MERAGQPSHHQPRPSATSEDPLAHSMGGGKESSNDEEQDSSSSRSFGDHEAMAVHDGNQRHPGLHYPAAPAGFTYGYPYHGAYFPHSTIVFPPSASNTPVGTSVSSSSSSSVPPPPIVLGSPVPSHPYPLPSTSISASAAPAASALYHLAAAATALASPPESQNPSKIFPPHALTSTLAPPRSTATPQPVHPPRAYRNHFHLIPTPSPVDSQRLARVEKKRVANKKAARISRERKKARELANE